MEAAAAARNSVCVISGKASSPRGSSISYRDHVENDGDEEARPLAETHTPEQGRSQDFGIGGGGRDFALSSSATAMLW